MMKKGFIVILLFGSLPAWPQTGKLVERMKYFHQLMIRNDFVIGNYIHDSLSYGHSSGWVENAKEFREHLGSYIIYHSIKEDSIVAVSTGKLAHIRFVADLDVTFKGVRSQFRLKVLEVWVKIRKTWKIFARQAIK
jgi:hypothetical protein